MRKFVARVVAFEIILIGLLAYWIFFLYSTSQALQQDLAARISALPDLKFSTTTILFLGVMTIIGISVAVKIERRLYSGIRLEKALAQADDLMRKNLALETRLAEVLKEKSNPPMFPWQTEEAYRPAILTQPPLQSPVAESKSPVAESKKVATSKSESPSPPSEQPKTNKLRTLDIPPPSKQELA